MIKKNLDIKGNLLLIFIKNPEPGKVKTRLAASVGPEKAYQIYLKLLSLTIDAATQVDAVKQVWYSSYVDSDDFISEKNFNKRKQMGENLGARMLHAFKGGFKEGYDNIVIIGSDCPDVNHVLLEQAFIDLSEHDLVIGPSADGGYCLLGMNKLEAELFRDIDWSTEHVLEQTLEKAKSLTLSVTCLPELNDIDTIEDLEKADWDETTSN
jgi:rSAM/selenodomain-associated transferase 1